MNQKRLSALRVAKGYHILPVKPGMQVELHEHVGEGNNKRIWKFKGLVIKVKKPNHPGGTFTIRGKTAGHTIEKIYPLSFPNFDKVILVDEYKIRRAKLYYLRDKVGKDARLTSVLTNAEKNVDLLQLAKEEIDALVAANTPEAPVEQVKEESANEEVNQEETQEQQSEEQTQEENAQEQQSEEQAQEENAQE